MEANLYISRKGEGGRVGHGCGAGAKPNGAARITWGRRPPDWREAEAPEEPLPTAPVAYHHTTCKPAPPSLPLLLTGQSAFTTATRLALVLQPLRLMEATEEGPVSCARVARLLRPRSQGRRAERVRRRLLHKLRRSHMRVISQPSASRGCARKPCAWPAGRAHAAAADVAEAAPASRACGQQAERKKRRRQSQRLRRRAERDQRPSLRLHQWVMRGGGQLQTVQRRLGRRGRLQR